ncbi:DNA (cytosine-5-)-methyltransferase [Acinetobacter pittii]|uniref:DNA cytosine methyltransferase n=1 Tax=Acinetobacter pittii TaxID=48296 RepID=UPI001980B596|nr:DNA (cytosine-5-)-methyltransferase [Acinetobacter pittii]MBN6520690.1 DNA (cytosine-5-)-methyltransferase [Acinetobacter pittii]
MTGKVLGLFAGIGGLELGLAAAGYESCMLCEIEPGAREVLKTHFPEVDLIDDVRNIASIPQGVRVITAGFPCQDLSSSGKKVGIKGERSFLVDEVFRLLEQDNDLDWVILENVKFMLHLNNGSAISYITSRFNQLGYNWAYRVINSESFGLPQRRHRVYFIASKKHDPRHVLLADNHTRNTNSFCEIDIVPRGFYWTEGRYSTGLNHNGIPPIKAGSTIGIPSPPAILLPTGEVGTPNIKDAERMQGFPENWTQPSEKVLKASHRWKLIGNSVSVPISKWIGERLKAPGYYDSSHDSLLKPNSKWPQAAWGIDGIVKISNVSEWPLDTPYQGLDEFLKYPLKPLSLKATKGYVSRAEQGNLKHPNGFLDQLKQYIEGLN